MLQFPRLLISASLRQSIVAQAVILVRNKDSRKEVNFYLVLFCYFLYRVYYTTLLVLFPFLSIKITDTIQNKAKKIVNNC